MVSSVLKSYQDMRADMDEMHDDAYEKAMAMAAKVGVAPTAPVIAPTLQLQQQRSIIGPTWLLHFLTTSFSS